MNLLLEDFRKITQGCASVSEENGKIRFHRFTEEEESFYEKRDALRGTEFRARCSAPAGVKLAFVTDSRNLKISVALSAATSRSYFSFDVFENGKLLGFIDNFKENELPLNYTEEKFPLGKYEKSFSLSDGDSHISIYFPWSVFVDDFGVELDEGSNIEAVTPRKKILVYGDSITQGYDAIRPSNRYAAKIADFLAAEEINKAIGGEVFVPGLAKIKQDFAPDYISVAYGTNDWSTTSGENFYENARDFYEALSKNYPDTPIFAISPIWRANFEDEKPFGSFFSVEKIIREVAAEFKNVKVISGFDLVSHDKMLFADLRLHPRDAGFKEYFENLSKKIGEQI